MAFIALPVLPKSSASLVSNLSVVSFESNSSPRTEGVSRGVPLHVAPHSLLPLFRLPLHLTTPLTAALNPLCSILWLRESHLRLWDNPAVNFVCASSLPTLPVVTLLRHRLSPTLRSIVADLGHRLHAAGSRLIVRVAQSALDEVHIIHQLATRITASSVVLNQTPVHPHVTALRPFVLHLCNETSFKSSSTLSFLSSPASSMRPSRPAPSRLPPPPAAPIFSSIVPSAGVFQGESIAHEKLARLLHRIASLPALCLALLPELNLGLLTRGRVSFEYRRFCTFRRPVSPSRFTPFSSFRSFFARLTASPALTSLSIAAYDVNGPDRRGVKWDEATNSFLLQEWEHEQSQRNMEPAARVREFIRRRRLFFQRAFFPEDVTPDYYSFTLWRFAQRCVSATVGVFGTSSLLFALGIRSGRIGQAAVISWVLKDGLGRVGKMLWAGSMGKDFDVDPKRWRFRSALLYAMGSGLEIVTQIFPASFLLFATAANTMKQVSMLTASATRNAMYRSFGGKSQNIANITAKGEAQIVVADLIGMATGIRLSKVVTNTGINVLAVYGVLSCLDIFGIYMELRQVVFRTINAERANFLVESYLNNGGIMTPGEVSKRERIFMKPRYLSRIRLSSIAKAAQDPKELGVLLKVFRKEHFMVTLPRTKGGVCRLVLRRDSGNEDVLRAILMVGYVQRTMMRKDKSNVENSEMEAILKSARRSANRDFKSFVRDVEETGWSTDNLLFSTMKRRGYWRREG